ncbi:MAG: DUF2269 family protein [Ignavibacteriaceae bacterium]
MEFYFVILFIHITSALVLFMTMAIEWVGISKLQNTVVREQIDEWIKFILPLKYIFMSVGTLLLFTGAYLVSAKWNWSAWIIVSILMWVFLFLHIILVTGKRVEKLNKLINSNNQMLDSELHVNIGNLSLMNLLQSEIAVGLGQIFIMTVKPDLVGSVCVIIVAIILGIAPLLSKRKN